MIIHYTNAHYLGEKKIVIETDNLNIDGIEYGHVRANINETVIGKILNDYFITNDIEIPVLPHEDPYRVEQDNDELLKQSITIAVQAHIDGEATTKGYDNANSCVSYYNSEDEIFAKEAKAMSSWRDKCWRYCYNLLEQYTKGEVERPTVEYVLENLPKLEW